MQTRAGTKTSVEVIRLIVVLGATGLGYTIGRANPSWFPAWDSGTTVLVCAILGAAVGYLVGGVLGRFLRAWFGVVERSVDRAPASEVVSGVLGGLVGLAGGVLVAMPFILILPASWAVPVSAVLIYTAAALSFRLARVKSRDILALAGLGQRFTTTDVIGTGTGQACLLDSSAIVDGRLLALSRSGFLAGPVVLPRFVLEEIQSIADASDAGRRRRGRRGLEILDALRGETSLAVIDDEVPEAHNVDAKLVHLARRLPAALITTDFNLQKVAELQGVWVMNVNRLAEALRPPVAAGDELQVKIEAEGTEEGQGVGYTEDGTMVVVSNAAGRVGEVVEAIVSSAHQTSKGRMLFARQR
ncbi:MAG: TRAM domain-containing protein [Acidimicrobiia bacterium]|nr:TRAM domain-containing protein [Acidimicrobiia bacterium]